MKKFAFFVCLVATFVAVPAAIADGGWSFAGTGAMELSLAPVDGAW